MKTELVVKIVVPPVCLDDFPTSHLEDPESLELSMESESVSTEIRNKLVRNISAYCDCV